jgi:hypothetical protein
MADVGHANVGQNQQAIAWHESEAPEEPSLSGGFVVVCRVSNRVNDLGVDSSPRRQASGTNMTTTLIYEPIAYISDDYFCSPNVGGSVNSRDSTDDQSVLLTRKLARNINEGNAIRWMRASEPKVLPVKQSRYAPP